MSKHSIFRRTAGVVAVFAVLAGCGDSDLEELHSVAVADAQRQATLQAASQPPTGAATGSTDNGSMVDEQTPPVVANPGTGPDPAVVTGSPSPLVTGSDVEALIAGSTLVFSDEFNGASVDSTKWNTKLQWGPDIIVNDETQYYIDVQNAPDFGVNPFVFNGETVAITAQSTPSDALEKSKNQPYLSGVLTTYEKFDFTYGYAEIRARLPAGKGYWPGFWMLSTDFSGLKPQLYVMEGKGDVTNVVYHHYNYIDASDNFVPGDFLITQGDDFSADYHTYGVEWSEGSIKYYVDQVLQQTITNGNVSNQAMYLILNLAVGGWFPGPVDTNTVFPESLDVDYVRVYKQN